MWLARASGPQYYCSTSRSALCHRGLTTSKVFYLSKPYLLNELDKILVILGFIFSLVLIISSLLGPIRPMYMIVGILSLLACTAYLLIRKSVISYLDSGEASSRFYIVSNIIFFALFSYVLLCFSLRLDPYTRPISYFIATALMTSVLAVEILFLPGKKWCSYFVLLKVAMIGTSLEFSQLLMYPSLVGVDPWFHQMFTLKVLNIGHIPEGYSYSQLPLMHLLIGSTSLLTGFDYKIATMLSVSLPQVLCDVLFTFLLGNLLFNKKVGLLGSLLLSTANLHVHGGLWTIPNTMGATFILPITYLLFKRREEKSHVSLFLSMLLMGSIILTHTLAAACMAMLLFAFWAGLQVYWRRREGKMPIRSPLTLGLSVFFSVGMFSWWTYASGHISTLADLIRWGFRLDYFLSPMPPDVVRYGYYVPFSEQLLNNLCMYLFFVGSLIGCLYMLSKHGDSHSFAMAIGGSTVLGLMSLASITGHGAVLIERWWYFSQILLALPLAAAFLLLCWIAKNNLGKAVLLAFLIFSLTFLMIMSQPANLDNPTFSPNTQVRFSFTRSELEVMEKASRMWSGPIGADAFYSDLCWSSYSVEDVSWQIYDRNYTDCQHMFILIRKEVVNNPFKLFQAVYKLDYDPRNTLTEQAFSKVYDCDSVSGFVYSKP